MFGKLSTASEENAPTTSGYKKELTIQGTPDSLDFANALALGAALGQGYVELRGGDETIGVVWGGKPIRITKAEIPNILLELSASLVEYAKSSRMPEKERAAVHQTSAATSLVWEDYIENRRRW